MKKEEILEKSRQENKEMDERERLYENKSFRFTFLIVMVVVGFYDLMMLPDDMYPLSFLIFSAFASSKYYFDYAATKKKSSLVIAICATLVFVVCVCLKIVDRFNLWEYIR